MPAAAEELKHVTVLNTHRDSSGKPSTNPQVQCVHCSHTFRGGATRIRGHLAHTQGCGVSFCDQVPTDTKLHCKEIHTNKLEISAKIRRLAALDQLSHSDSADSGLKQPTLNQSFSKATKADTDASVARFFCAEGVAFQGLATTATLTPDAMTA